MMAYINVAEWTVTEVTDWLKGLDDSMYNYIFSFTNNEVRGQQLLNIRPYELEQLGMYSIGHQEIVLEAVELLRNFHYNLDKENLQFLALHVASRSRNLYRQLSKNNDKSKLETQILSDITQTIATIKNVINWVDRPPFQGQFQFIEIRKNMLRLANEMATTAQRDRFVENPVDQVRMIAEKLAKLADYIIQDITDPMVLQPSSLKLVTLKKRESELGFSISQNHHGIHRVTDIKYNSPAHTAGKIEDGDEIVQINYQTVVGWRNKTVILQLRESPPDILLTLKKRPKHTKIYGQIYMQPYRLPSKKRSLTARWINNLPSPRPELLPAPDFTKLNPLKESNEKLVSPNTANNSSDTDSICSDILTPTDSKSAARIYYPKPTSTLLLQRRNTISGDEFQYLKSVGTVPIWHEQRRQNPTNIQDDDPSSPSLRDKSVSFGYGLEIATRPTTCLGITNNSKHNELNTGNNNSMPEISKDKTSDLQTDNKPKLLEMAYESKPGVCKVVRFDGNMKFDDYPMDNKNICFIDNTILETFEPIPYADEEEEEEDTFDECNELLCREPETQSISASADTNTFDFDESTKIALSNIICNKTKDNDNICQAVNTISIQQHQRRGRLDKSHSTPAYDDSADDLDQMPPAIEPRKEFLSTPTPPVPPRPRKVSTEPQLVPVPPPKPQKFFQQEPFHKNNQSCINNNVEVIETVNELELQTPLKSKNLTLKKKNILIAKRRKITLKTLGQVGDIQGHLYRRTKDKRGITFWAKLYFVLIDTVLYGFRTKDASKANCMIILPGFTVGLAKEVHSKSFAFKVYHSTKTFYFAAESGEALSQWIEMIKKATVKEICDNGKNENCIKELFSETDSSGDDSDQILKQLCTPSPITSPTRDFPGGKTETPVMSKPDNKYLGSLKKLTKSSLHFNKTGGNSNVHNEKKNSEIPVPTAQFRSFRKVPGGSFGLQIGTNSPYFDNNYSPKDTSHQLFFSNVESTSKKQMPIVNLKQMAELIEPKITISSADSKYQCNVSLSSTPSTPENNAKKLTKRTSPHNFIHASNPNLVEFDFQTSKTLDYSMPKINTTNPTWDPTTNSLQGFVTLKDLMLQKQEEEAKEMYTNRVVVGVEKKDKQTIRISSNFENISNSNPTALTSNKLSKNLNRSLPKTPDYEISFKPDDEDIKRTRTKEGQKLRDFGYEFIYGDEPDDKKILETNKDLQKYQLVITGSSSSHGRKKYSVNSAVLTEVNALNNNNKNTYNCRGGSFKKSKNKFDVLKTSSERIFQFKHHHQSEEKLKSFSPNTLPKKSSQQNYEISLKKSQTYNNEFKDKKLENTAHRKNSAPTMPILSKFPFSNKTSKEKKLLGSPRLHRAIFGRTSSRLDHDCDHEIFSPLVKKNSQTSEMFSNSSALLEPSSEKATTNQPLPQNTQQSAYPNMIVPPVFQPETYSLSDPNASLTLIRRRSTNTSSEE